MIVDRALENGLESPYRLGSKSSYQKATVFTGTFTAIDATQTFTLNRVDDALPNQAAVAMNASQLRAIASPVVEIGDVGISQLPGKVVISWQGINGVTYAVQCTPDLVVPAWSNVVTGLSGTGTISATNNTADPKAFYRTVVQ